MTRAQLAYADSHRVALGQDQRLTGSAGASYRIDRLLISADLLAGTGARRSRAPGAINDARLGGYAVIGLAAVCRVRFLDRPADLRLDVTNLFDARYTLSDASRLEGGWTHFGERRGIFVGIEQGF